jgi:hypothetical protein
MKDEREAAYIKFKKQAGFDEKCSPDGAQRIPGQRLGHLPITSTLSLSLPGLTGQSSTHGRRLLDRPVKPGDDGVG